VLELLNVEEPQSAAGRPGFFGRSRARINSFLRRERAFIKFALVGASGLLVNEGVLYGLTRFGHLPEVPSQAIGIELSIINNFIWNDALTFKGNASGVSRWKRFSKYNLLSLITFAINLLIFTYLVSANVFDIYASIIAIIAAFGLNYFGSSRWAWRKHQKPAADIVP
jgi:dolichol-phosphate mannosyltransferase